MGENIGGWLHKHVVYDWLCFMCLCVVQLSTVYIHITRWLRCCLCPQRAIPKITCTIPVTITLMLQHFLKFSSMCKGLHHLLRRPNTFPISLPPVSPISPHFPPFSPFFLLPHFSAGI